MRFLWARDDEGINEATKDEAIKDGATMSEAAKGEGAGGDGETAGERAAAELLSGQRPGDDAATADVLGFDSQADAETWIGEHWRSLAGHGVSTVELTSVDSGGDPVKIYSLKLEGSS